MEELMIVRDWLSSNGNNGHNAAAAETEVGEGSAGMTAERAEEPPMVATIETGTNGHYCENDEREEAAPKFNPSLPLRAIQVVLRPPPDPESYYRVPPSRAVVRISDIEERHGTTFYEVEFLDGRMEQVSYENLISYRGGRAAVEAYETSVSLNDTVMTRNANKRPHSEDDYEESESDYSAQSKRPKRYGASRSYPSRRSTRQTSRQSSTDQNPDELGFEDSTSRLIDLADEDSGDMKPFTARSRDLATPSRLSRQTRSRNKKSHTVVDSEDELAHDHNYDDNEESEELTMIISDIHPAPRGAKRKKARTKIKILTRRDDRDSSIEFETTRRSARSTKNLKSMKDPEMDEYEVVEEKQAGPPRHAAIKEIFQQVPSDSRFRKLHLQTCRSCLTKTEGANNPLVHCQGCSFSYHKACIGLRAVREHRATKIGPENFVLQCRFCIQSYKKEARAPDYNNCQLCKTPGLSCAPFSAKKTPKQEEKARIDNGGEDPITQVDPRLVNNADNVLFRCTSCKRAYHFRHLPPLTTEIVDDADLETNRLEEYAMVDWNCKDCINTEHKIHALVAWRPTDQASYAPGATAAEYNEDNIEYLVKWKGRSHFHDTWMPGAWVFGVVPALTRQAFHKRDSSTYPKMDKAAAIEEEWLLADVLLNVKYRTRIITSSKAEDLERIDEITSVFVKFQGLSYEEVVWDEPPPLDSGAPWDAFVAAYDEYLNGKYFVAIPDYKMRDRIAHYRSLNFGRDCELKTQPPQLKKGRLMEYQMEGVNFLLYNFHQRQNVILADEMGLGKTVQIVAFISALVHSKPGCWPFLIVVPNATCSNWRRELKQWAPDLRVVTYHGGKTAQELAYTHELYPNGAKTDMKAHVVIMSYEAAGSAGVKNAFSAVKWVGLIVDEGQRLKNEETLLYKSLQDLRIPCRILLTGTPLQNNKRELFNLLQFIDGKRNADELDAKYAELTKENLPELHNLIRPYFLRRTKAQVLKFLPPMAQIILPVTMTVLQEKLAKSIMSRNPDLIRAIISKSKVKAGERKRMSNILSDLRQCLCHPFCFNTEVEDKTVGTEQMHRNLIEASPKLILFEIMLPKLKERGHRVLIFSQYLHSLTILEDFLTGLNLAHARIDGTHSALEKQKRIDAFNAPDSPLFAMLLSTRAGGVGINLATADTVIIYDPDFNPHQDIQALSRAHRIGQKRKVLCFQLMTKNTVEEKIMQMGRKKMVLDHALIESMDAKEEDSEDLESILKHGAAALFSDESKDRITYDDASVDKLLDRSQIENTDTGDDDSAETQFSFARIWANDKGDLTSTEPEAHDLSHEASTSIWENILKEREAQHERELAANQKVYGRGARRKGAQIDYRTNRPHKGADSADGSDVDVDDELYIDRDEPGDEDSDGGTASATPSNSGKTKPPKGAPPIVNNVPRPQPQPQPQPQPRPQPRNPPSAQAPRLPAHRPRTQQEKAPLPKSNLTSQRQPFPPHQPTVPEQRSVGRPPKQSPLNPPVAIPAAIPQYTTVPHYQQGLLNQSRPVRLPNGVVTTTGWIGGGNPCAICGRSHPTHAPCTDLNSERSLRLALDRLRGKGDLPMVDVAQAFFAERLQAIIALRQGR
ncbi:PHD/FYVE-zinc-finger like domain-containing protein [Nemania sp. FL0916]|nr:PHD/FYVE-zinc-finger like domain-containing protein [Nemania sp. FL0916]